MHGVLLLYCVSLLLLLLGMQVVKLGGPVYRIGVGGGSASSVEVSNHIFFLSRSFADLMCTISRMTWLLIVCSVTIQV
jgi:hypothetical protein